MPVSKRAKKVTLSKTKKKAPDVKRSGYVDLLRSGVEQCASVFGVGISEFARENHYKALRATLAKRGSRLFLGKRSLMRVALGTAKESELRPNFRKLAAALDTLKIDALVATDLSKDEIQKIFDEAAEPTFATAGFVPATKMALDQGTLEDFGVPMHDQLKKLGLPVQVKDSKLELVAAHTIATPKAPLTAEQAKILKLLDIKLTTFHPTIKCQWTNGDFELVT